MLTKKLMEIDGEGETVNDKECASHREATVLSGKNKSTTLITVVRDMEVIPKIRPILFFTISYI